MEVEQALFRVASEALANVARPPRTNVVTLTSYHGDEHVLSDIRAGALSYVLKEIGPDELPTPSARPPSSPDAGTSSAATSPS